MSSAHSVRARFPLFVFLTICHSLCANVFEQNGITLTLNENILKRLYNGPSIIQLWRSFFPSPSSLLLFFYSFNGNGLCFFVFFSLFSLKITHFIHNEIVRFPNGWKEVSFFCLSSMANPCNFVINSRMKMDGIKYFEKLDFVKWLYFWERKLFGKYRLIKRLFWPNWVFSWCLHAQRTSHVIYI